MSPSTFAVISTVIGVLYLLALVGLGIFGALRTSGRTRALVLAGVGVMVFERLLGFLFPVVIGVAGGRDQIWTIQVLWNVLGALFTVAGIALLVMAAVTAQASRSVGAYPAVRTPSYGYPGQPPQQQGPGPQGPGPQGGAWR